MRKSRYKHPHSDHWLKRSHNHVMGNRRNEIERGAKMRQDEANELWRDFLSAFIVNIMQIRISESDRDRVVRANKPAWGGTFGRELYEALH